MATRKASSEHNHPDPDCGLCRVEMEHLSVTAENETILEDVTAHIHCGEVTALIGPNGAGKTTLLKALLGQMKYTGRVSHVDSQGRAIGAVRVGYVPQHLEFDRQMPCSVCDLMAASLTRFPVWLGIGRKTRERVLSALKTVHAGQLIDKRLGALSGGEMQRVLLAMALTPVPQLLILDEPVSGVDQNGLKTFLDTVSSVRTRYHMAVLLVSHDWDMVRRFADRVILLDRTVLEAGRPEDVFASRAFDEAFPLRR